MRAPGPSSLHLSSSLQAQGQGFLGLGCESRVRSLLWELRIRTEYQTALAPSCHSIEPSRESPWRWRQYYWVTSRCVEDSWDRVLARLKDWWSGFFVCFIFVCLFCFADRNTFALSSWVWVLPMMSAELEKAPSSIWL